VNIFFVRSLSLPFVLNHEIIFSFCWTQFFRLTINSHHHVTQIHITMLHKFTSPRYRNSHHHVTQIHITTLHKFTSPRYTNSHHDVTQIHITMLHKFTSICYTNSHHKFTSPCYTNSHHHVTQILLVFYRMILVTTLNRDCGLLVCQIWRTEIFTCGWC